MWFQTQEQIFSSLTSPFAPSAYAPARLDTSFDISQAPLSDCPPSHALCAAAGWWRAHGGHLCTRVQSNARFSSSVDTSIVHQRPGDPRADVLIHLKKAGFVGETEDQGIRRDVIDEFLQLQIVQDGNDGGAVVRV